MEQKEDKLKFLYHGLEGSKAAKQHHWLEADIKEARDGGGDSKWYQSGFHSFESLTMALNYLTRFTRPDLVIVECETKVEWKKPTNSDVILSKFINIGEVVYARKSIPVWM